MSYYSDLANKYQGMAADIQTRLDAQTPPMNPTQYTALEKQRDGLLDKATEMVAADLQHTLSTLQIDTVKLKNTTDQLKAAIKTVQKVDKLVAIATAAFTLATGIASANPDTIASGIAAAAKALSAKDASTAESAGDSDDSSDNS